MIRVKGDEAIGYALKTKDCSVFLSSSFLVVLKRKYKLIVTWFNRMHTHAAVAVILNMFFINLHSVPKCIAAAFVPCGQCVGYFFFFFHLYIYSTHIYLVFHLCVSYECDCWLQQPTNNKDRITRKSMKGIPPPRHGRVPSDFTFYNDQIGQTIYHTFYTFS